MEVVVRPVLDQVRFGPFFGPMVRDQDLAFRLRRIPGRIRKLLRKGLVSCS